jgi:hypothetical protein
VDTGKPATLYEIVTLNSREGQGMLVQSISAGDAAAYFPLAEQFLTQSSPPLCGPATIAMVLNSLAIDPNRVWKGVWRWYSEEMLLACASMDWSVGLTMQEFAHLAECNGTIVSNFVSGGPGASLEEFRASVQRLCADDTMSRRLVVNFSRATLGQTGEAGHYSPVAAYNREKDSVLILDVARFKYPPFWVPVPLLAEAMKEIDPSTGSSRGFFEIQKTQEVPEHEKLSKCSYSFDTIQTVDQLRMVSKEEVAQLEAFIPSLLCHSERVAKEMRPLSHFLRMEYVGSQRETEVAIRNLRELLAPFLEETSWQRSQLESLWPSHPQIAIELTALVIILCTKHVDSLQPFRNAIGFFSTYSPAAGQKPLHPQLTKIVHVFGEMLGIPHSAGGVRSPISQVIPGCTRSCAIDQAKAH